VFTLILFAMCKWKVLWTFVWLAVCVGGGVARAQTAGQQAVASFDQLVRSYNLISLGNASFTSYGDTEGALAVAGNLSLDGGAVATKTPAAGVGPAPTLYVGGNLTLNGTTSLNSGYASTPALGGGWSWDGTQARLSGGGGVLSTINSSDSLARSDPRGNPAPTAWNWTTLADSFKSISATLAAIPPTGTISISGQTLSLLAPVSAQTGDVVTFTLNANLLSGNTYDGQMFSNVQFNVPAGLNFVVNVVNADGKTLFGTGSGINFNSGSGYDALLWNIVAADNGGPTPSVSLGNGGQFFGAVLAPSVNLSNAGGTAVNGQVVAANYTHSGAELHYTDYTPTLVFSAVPEPSTWGACGLGLCFLAVVVRRLRRCGRS